LRGKRKSDIARPHNKMGMEELSEKMDNIILELKNIDISLGDLER